jgi:hypothetical protein
MLSRTCVARTVRDPCAQALGHRQCLLAHTATGLRKRQRVMEPALDLAEPREHLIERQASI